MAEYIKKNRRRFDRQFKEDAVALVRSGRSQAVVARDLGVSSGVLSTWVQQLHGTAERSRRAARSLSPRRSKARVPSSANSGGCARKTTICASSVTS